MSDRFLHYKTTFKKVLCLLICVAGMEGHLLWEDNWVTFIDAMMQMTLLSQPGKHLVLPTGIRCLSINPEQHRNKTLPTSSNKTGINVPDLQVILFCLSMFETQTYNDIFIFKVFWRLWIG